MQNYKTLTPALQLEHLTSEKEKASKNVEIAAATLEHLNKESLKQFDEYYDKILFYSAGAFSFTLALVSLIVQQEKISSLSNTSFLFPNIYWLYASWFFYLLASILIVINKKFHAHYLGLAGMSNYSEKVKLLRLSEIELLSLPNAQVITTDNTTNPIEKLKENKDMIEEKEKENKRLEKFYYKMKISLSKISELLALFATIFLLIFSIQVTQNIVW